MTAVQAYSARDSIPETDDSNWSAITATDGELLMRFTRHRDAAAFAEIVERHAGLVWIVCREALGHHQDVEDAFQATFFILAEQSAKIRSCDSAAAWLYKVAQRTALAARRKRAQRREEELTTELPSEGGGERLIHDQQMIYVLMEELRGLPERYRTPLVLRYLEGRTRRTIAAQTDSTLPQVQGRLVRGRRLLRSRMARRGVSLSLASGVMAGLVTESGAAVPASLATATAKGCVGLVASGAAGGASVAAVELAKQGIKAMWLASFMKSSAVVSTVFIAAGVAWAVESGVSGGRSESNALGKLVALQVSEVAEASPNEPPAAGSKTREAQTTTPNTNKSQLLLERRIAHSQDVLTELVDKKANQSAELELLQNRKSQLKRELERLEESLSVTKTPSSVDIALDKATKDQRAELADIITVKSKNVQDELSKATMETAKLSAEVEVLQMNVQRNQRRLEALDRLADQAQYDFTNQARFEAMSAATTINLDRFNTTGVISDDKAADGKLEPGDTVRVQVSNAFADQPLNSVYAVESMGTVALGPAYGRVNVKGMTVLEAEEAITKQLAKVIEKPEVQVTLADTTFEVSPEVATLQAGVKARDAEIAALHEQLEKLRAAKHSVSDSVPTKDQIPQLELERQSWQLKAEAYRLKAQQKLALATSERAPGDKADGLLMEADANHAEAMMREIDKQLESLRTADQQQSKPSSSLSEKDVLRPGDPIEIVLWPRDSKEAGQALRLRVNGDGQVQIDPKMRPIEISGVDERRAEKIIRDFFGTPTSRYREVRVRRFDP